MKTSYVAIAMISFSLLFCTVANAKSSTVTIKSKREPCITTLYQNDVIKYKFSSLGTHDIAPGEYHYELKCKNGGMSGEMKCLAGEDFLLLIDDDIVNEDFQKKLPAGHRMSLIRK